MSGGLRAHYGFDADLAGPIRERLAAAGVERERITTRDLAGVDEFHIGGRAATLELARMAGLVHGMRVLDLGCGLGGPARTMAETLGCDVTGLDLTHRFIAAARTLSSWVDLGTQTRFVSGDATSLPFVDGTFDAVTTIHVTMNIAAKDRCFAEVWRALLPGGRFALYDVVRGEGEEPIYPVPWAADPSASHLVRRAEVEQLLRDAGFEALEVVDTTAASLAWLEARRTAPRSEEPARPRLDLVMGPGFPAMTRNLARNLAEGRVGTVMIAAARSGAA